MEKFSIYPLLKGLMNRIAEDSHVVFFIGVMFILSGVLSLLDKVIEDIIGQKIEFFHGAIFLGVFNICMSLVFLFNGIKSIKTALCISEKDVKKPVSVEERIAEIEKELSELKAGLIAWKIKSDG
jgi:hypothetical protein